MSLLVVYVTSTIFQLYMTAQTDVLRLGYCLTPYQRLRLYNGAPFSRLLRHAGDTEDVFSTKNPRRPHGGTDVQADRLIDCLTSKWTIFQSYLWYRCAGGLKKLDLRSGPQRHRHFVGFFNVPKGDCDTPPQLVAVYDTLGIHSRLRNFCIEVEQIWKRWDFNIKSEQFDIHGSMNVHRGALLR